MKDSLLLAINVYLCYLSPIHLYHSYSVRFKATKCGVFMLLRFFCFFVLLSTLWIAPFSAIAQDDGQGLIQKGKVKMKLNKARRRFLNNDLQGALNVSREVLAADKDNPRAHFIIARSHYKLLNYDLALENFQKAYDGNPEVDDEIFLWFGKTYHRKGKLDDAIDSYKDFKGHTKEGKKNQSNVDRLIDQCKYAKKARKNPKKASIENLGETVNTRFDEYAPSITSDGETMVFTSRRPDTKGGGIDEKGDHRYYEDVYVTHRNEEGEWGEPKGIPGRINTVKYDAVLSIAPDGKSIYIYRNNPEHHGDIYVSKKSDRTGKWRRPKLLPEPINTSYYEGSITSTVDGNTLYFISERKGGEGRGDVYRISRESERDEWGKAKNLGEPVNTERDEKFLYITPEGNTLFFASNGHKSLGKHDILVTTKKDGEWSDPKNIGYPINTVNEESTFSLSSDFSTMYIAGSYEKNFGRRDIYRVDVSDHEIISKHKPVPKAVVKGTVKGDDGNALRCTVKMFDSESDQMIGEQKTDRDGKYQFRVPVNKKYELRIDSKGYSPVKEEVRIASDQAGNDIVKELTAEKK